MSTPVTLPGRLVRDPEMRFSASGKAVTTFSVVTSRRVRNDQSGEWEDRDTTFWNCVAFGSLAENIAESALSKGMAVIVCGRAYQEEWEAKDGSRRRSVKVTADDVAPSLRFASAKVARAQRDRGRQDRAPDPWDGERAGSEPPF